MSSKIYHLTDKELVSQLSLRDDLSDTEGELLDRLTRATDELTRLDTLCNNQAGELDLLRARERANQSP